MIIISPIFRLIAKIATIVFYLLTAICCFGGLIPPKVSALPSVATIGMPYMVICSALLVVVWLCMKKWIVAGLGIAMLFLCSSPIKMWFPMNSPAHPDPEDAPTLTLLTWNTLHGDDLEKPDYDGSRMLETILKYKPDIVCLQEVYGFNQRCLRKFKDSTMDSIRAIYPYELGEGTYDVRILSRYPIRHTYFGSLNNVRFAETFTVKTPSRDIAVANVHLPSFLLNENEKGIFHIHNADVKEKEKLGLKILKKLEKAFPIRARAAKQVLTGLTELSMPIIICGDFNDVPASYTYRLFIDEGFKDAYDATNFWPTYTFYPNYLYFHLDQILYRGAIRPLSVERLDIRTSDHLPLLATFQLLNGY